MIAFLALRPPRSECSRSTGEDFIHIALIDAVLRIWFSVHKGQPAAVGAHAAPVRPAGPDSSGTEGSSRRQKGHDIAFRLSKKPHPFRKQLPSLWYFHVPT